MKIEEILALVPEDKKESAKKTLEENGAVNADKVSKFLKSDEGTKLIQPQIDSAVTKALKTYEKNFMDNEFPKRLDEKVKELHPDETPEQKRIAVLEAENRKIKTDHARQEQIAKAQKKLETMGLPVDLASRYAGLTDDETDANINSLSMLTEWRDKAVKSKDDEWLAKSGKPGGGNGNGGMSITEQEFKEMSPKDRFQFIDNGGLVNN